MNEDETNKYILQLKQLIVALFLVLLPIASANKQTNKLVQPYIPYQS